MMMRLNFCLVSYRLKDPISILSNFRLLQQALNLLELTYLLLVFLLDQYPRSQKMLMRKDHVKPYELDLAPVNLTFKIIYESYQRCLLKYFHFPFSLRLLLNETTNSESKNTRFRKAVEFFIIKQFWL